MADEKKNEILVIEPGMACVTKSKPYKIKTNLLQTMPGLLANVKEIVIEKNVSAIGQNAFYECTQLTSFVISDSVTKIGDQAFFKL